MPSVLRYTFQAVVYLGIALLIGSFANGPSYEHFPSEQAQIKLTLVHGAERRAECHRRTAEELEQLAPNMRKAVDCPRERLPVWIELRIDGAVFYQASLPPTGLSQDGPSRTYRRFAVAPGTHRLQLRLRDTARTEGYDFELDRQVELKPQQNLAIDFRPESGGFILM